MVGDDFQAWFFHAESCAGFAGNGFEQVLEQVDFVVAVNMLHDGGHALQAHAGIDGRLGQRIHIALFVAVELHEYAVPNFDPAVAVFFRAARNAAPDFFAVVVENFGARAARAGVAHLPEVVGRVFGAFVVADADDALGRHTDFVQPDVVGFVVFCVNGRQEFVFRDVQPFRGSQEFPSEVDRVALEIVAEGEVAHHFKEGMVAGGVADVFQVVVFAACAYAFLRGSGAVVGAFVEAEEYVFKLVHACVGKQQGRVVVWHERGRADDGVAFRFEKFQEFLA